MAFPVSDQKREDLPLSQIARDGFVRGEEWKEQAEVDRQLYGSRFDYLCGESRLNDNSHLRYYQNNGAAWNVPATGMMFQLPDVLPGSNNIRTNGTGATPGTRGAMAFRAYAESCIVECGVRHVILDGNGAFVAFGAYTTVQLDFTAAGFGAGTPGWLPNPATSNLLLPADTTGAGFVGPGDLLQYYVAYKANNGINPARLYHWDLREPILLNANP